MISHIHQKLGTAGFIISIVALVAALGGGAYAASGGLNGKQKKEVEKIAKKYAGKPGAAGANGAPGANGTNGAKGDTGAAGSNGTNGTNGKEGSPWVAGGTLPIGQTETGTWSVNALSVAETTHVRVPISFPIPLPEAVKAVYLSPTETSAEAEKEGCFWEFSEPAALPQAPSGTLCVWAEPPNESERASGFSFFESHEAGFFEEASPTGAVMWMGVEGVPGNATELPKYAKLVEAGVWAVTAG